MRQAVADVIEFMRAMGQEVPETPTIEVSPKVPSLRVDLIEEELDELHAAMAKKDIVGIADAFTDLAYVVIGGALAYGIDLAPTWDAVHAANLLKSTGPVLPSGKRGKPANFEHPDLGAILVQQCSLDAIYPEKAGVLGGSGDDR